MHKVSDSRLVFGAVIGVFLLCGFSATMNDSLIPYVQDRLALNYKQVMAIQLCFYMAYFSVCPLAGWWVGMVGPRRGLLAGLLCGGIGCFLIFAASLLNVYLLILSAVFTLGAGVSILQVTANPLAVMLGSTRNAAGRLTFAQAFTGLGMVIAPFAGSFFLAGHLGELSRHFHWIYLPMAVAWLAWAEITKWIPFPKELDAVPKGTKRFPEAVSNFFKNPRLILCFAALFLYVGIEVSIGSFLIRFLGRPDIGALPMSQASKFCSLYWAGLFVGRLAGYRLMSRSNPALLILGCATGGIMMMFIATMGTGGLAMWGVIVAGLCNSIMFPAVFAIGMRLAGDRKTEAAGVLCMANVGGAVLPVIQGAVADAWGIQASFVIPFAGYFLVVLYAIACIGELVPQMERN